MDEKEKILDELSSFCINKLRLFMIKNNRFNIVINENIAEKEEFVINWYAVLCNLMNSKMYISGKKLGFIKNYSKLKNISKKYNSNFKYTKYVEGGDSINISEIIDMLKSVLSTINSENNSNYTLEELLNV